MHVPEVTMDVCKGGTKLVDIYYVQSLCDRTNKVALLLSSSILGPGVDNHSYLNFLIKDHNWEFCWYIEMAMHIDILRKIEICLVLYKNMSDVAQTVMITAFCR